MPLYKSFENVSPKRMSGSRRERLLVKVGRKCGGRVAVAKLLRLSERELEAYERKVARR